MAWDASRALALSLVAALLTVGLASAFAASTATPASSSKRVGAPNAAAFAWTSEHPDALVAPLIDGIALRGWGDQAIASYEAGQAWAQTRMETADRAGLAAATEAVLAHALEETRVPARFQQAKVGDVPAAFVGPLTALLEAQVQADAGQVSIQDAGDPWEASRVQVSQTAWLLGAIDGVLPVLHAASDQAPEVPVTLDPLGLIVLGSSGDDVYDPVPVGPVTWRGPLVLVEPGGDEKYNVPVASESRLHIQPVTVRLDLGPLAIDLEGDDRYASTVAAARNGGFHALVDEGGNDTYGTLQQGGSIAAAKGGLGYLADKRGNDTYKVRHLGIAYARIFFPTTERWPSLAVLGDWEGNDTYQARTEFPLSAIPKGQTHATANNAGAIAVLRDYTGDDVYTADFMSLATSLDDGNAQLWDDEGDDAYSLNLHGGTTVGRKHINDGGQDAPTRSSLAYFLDGEGQDSYDRDRTCCGARHVENEHRDVTTAETQRYGIFIDCTTPPNADQPCPEDQAWVRETIIDTELDDAP